MDLDDKYHKISPEPSSNLSHEQTPVGGASSVSQDESRGLNEMTLNSLKNQEYEYAVKDRWKGLVNLMTPQDLQIQNRWGYKAFLMAAVSGNSNLVQIMIEKNQNLPLIKSTSGMLPVHLAAIGGHHKIVQDLFSKTLLQKMDIKDIKSLFFSIERDMFDVATRLFEEYPDLLAGARYGIALENLLQKPSKELSTNRGASSGDFLQLLQKLWRQLRRRLEWTGILKLIGSSCLVSAMADALESGNVEALKWLLSMNLELLTLKDSSNGQNILHYTVRQRYSHCEGCKRKN